MTDIRFPDISEFQPNVDQRKYYNSGGRVLLIRSHNGYRPDKIMPMRLIAARKVPFVAVGLYQYFVKDRESGQQARDFIAGIGKLAPNEFPILDYEEAAPGVVQTPRAQEWFSIVDKWAGFSATLYSGDYFFRAYLGSTSNWQRPTWIAAYQDNEPAQPHTFWQYSDKAPFAGIGACDGNIFHGTAEQFLRAVRRGQPQPPKPQPEATIISVVKHNGAIETFAQQPDGEVLHRWQKEENSTWVEQWSSLGTPGK